MIIIRRKFSVYISLAFSIKNHFTRSSTFTLLRYLLVRLASWDVRYIAEARKILKFREKTWNYVYFLYRRVHRIFLAQQLTSIPSETHFHIFFYISPSRDGDRMKMMMMLMTVIFRSSSVFFTILICIHPLKLCVVWVESSRVERYAQFPIEIYHLSLTMIFCF